MKTIGRNQEKKRYWVMDCRTGKNFICDDWNKKELAIKIGVNPKGLRIERFRFIKNTCLLATSGKTIYDIPFEEY